METATIEGLISINAVIAAQSRPVYKIYIDHQREREYLNDRERGRIDRDMLRLDQAVKSGNIPVVRVNAEQLDRMTDGSTHGGLVAVVGERKTVTLADLTQPANKHLTPFIVMLDGVEDPFNFGQAIRALYACGATGLIVRPRNWMSAAAIVARSSGGASELISMAVVEDPIEAMTTLRGLGLKIVVLDKTDDAIPLTQANLRDSIFVIIGGEKRGVSKAVLALADANIKIPYGRHFRQSLGTTSAAAILGYEVMRQRRVEGY